MGIMTVTRAFADLSWDRARGLPTLQLILIIIVLVSSLFDMAIYFYYSMRALSKIFIIFLNVSQIIRLVLLATALLALGRRPTSPTDAYYAAILSVIFSGLSAISKLLDYLINGSSTNKQRLSIQQKAVLFVLFYALVVLLVGAVMFEFVEGWSFSDAWNFVNVTALTIGYGNYYPKTVAGRILVITYGNLMVFMAAYLVVTIRELFLPDKLKQKRNVTLFLLGLILYIIFGSAIFMLMEKWTFLNSIYFVWSTLTTVGYGNIVPTRAISWEFWLWYVYSAVAFYGFGLGLGANTVGNMLARHNHRAFTHGSNVPAMAMTDLQQNNSTNADQSSENG